MFAIVDKLYSAAISAGVRFQFNINVIKIENRGKKAEGIILEDGSEIKGDIILANADLPYVYQKLLPDRRKSACIERMKYSCSAICFHWGLDKVYPQPDHHNVFISDCFRKGLYRIFNDKSVNDRPTFYVHAPTRTDPDAAPDKQDTLTVVVGAGHVDPKK